jgi:hypothetical protein
VPNGDETGATSRAGPKTDELPPEWLPRFPRELEYWIGQQAPFVQGIGEADQLRRRLLATTPQGDTYAARIARVVEAFQRQMAGNEMLYERVSQFRMSPDRLERQLRIGAPLGAQDVFHAFDGRWFGLWDVWPVNHDWRPSVIYQPYKQFAPEQPPLVAAQYAWIGNGFGWNYLAATDPASPLFVVLGQVYYLSATDYGKIEARKPHAGFADIPEEAGAAIQRLVWITEREAFLEEVFPQADGQESYYVITGLYHSLLREPPSVAAHAVQAKYTRDPGVRPPFKHFKWELPQELNWIQLDEP